MFGIYDKLGGKNAAVDVIAKRLRWRPSSHTVKKWHSNKSMSPRAAMALIEECRERGIKCDPIADFRGAAFKTIRNTARSSRRVE